MWEMGYGRVFLNPSVQLTYSLWQQFLLRYVKPTFDLIVAKTVHAIFDLREEKNRKLFS
jgi:hypothetical protein